MPDHKSTLATIELLAQTFPQCFSVFEQRRRPLKLGIHADILAASEIEPKALSTALRAYCGNHCYLEASKESAPRIDLEGNIVGSVSKDEADNAKERLEQQQDKYKRQREAKAKAEAKARNAGRISLADLRAAAQMRRVKPAA